MIGKSILKGVSKNGFLDALSSISGEGAKGFSATNIVSLKKSWEDDFNSWNRRDLVDKRYAFIRVDGIHFNILLEDVRCCILVIIGADEYKLRISGRPDWILFSICKSD